MAKKEISEEKSAFLRLGIALVCVAAGIAAVCGAICGISYLKHRNDILITDDEAKKVFEELIPKSETVNEIIWGAGLEIADVSNESLEAVTGAQYRPVADSVPYSSVDELRALTAEVYSESFISKSIAPGAFDGYKDESGASVASSSMEPRYSEIKITGTGEVVLARDITRRGFEIKTKIDPSTAHVSEHVLTRRGLFFRVTRVKIECSAFVSGEPAVITVGIVRENGEWRLDDPTY